MASFECDPMVICSPGDVLVTSTSIGALGLKWLIGNREIKGKSSFYHQFVNNSASPVTHEITLIAYGAEDNDTTLKIVTVNPSPEAEFELDTMAVVSGDSVQILNTSQGGESYDWMVGIRNTNDDFENRYFTFTNNTRESLTETVTLKVENRYECRDSITDSVFIYPKVTASIVSDTTKGCSPLDVKFKAVCENADYYAWDINGKLYENVESISRTFYTTNREPAVFYVKLTATSGYGITAVAYDTITVYPTVWFDYTFTAEGTSPFNLVIDNRSKNGDSYFWDFGDGDTLTTFASETLVGPHGYVNNTTEQASHLVSVIGKNRYECDATNNFSVSVYPQIKADFDFEAPMCTNDSVVFINKSINDATCLWSFGNGQSSTDTTSRFTYHYTNKFERDTFFRVQLIAISKYKNYTDTISKVVHIYATPDAVMKLEQAGNNPKSIVASAEVGGADYWEWDFGAVDPKRYRDEPVVRHTYDYPDITTRQTYQIKLIAVTTRSICPDTAVNTIYVYPFVEAKIKVDEAEGCTPLRVNFESMSKGAQTYSWDFANGNTAIIQKPTMDFVNNRYDRDTVYRVVLTARSAHGISDTDTIDITVHPRPYAAFEFENDVICPPDSAVIINKSNYYKEIEWYFSDELLPYTGGISETIKKNFENNTPDIQDERVRLYLENSYGCDVILTKYVTVNPSVEAAFVALDTVCSGTLVEFQNASIRASRYEWDFGDGSAISILRNPNYVFRNLTSKDTTYEVTLTAHNALKQGCSDQFLHQIVVYPEADFNLVARPTTVQLPNANVRANSNLKNMKDWRIFWDFGNGSVQLGDTSAMHKYGDNEDYIYVLRLDLTDTITGCSYTDQVEITVESADPMAEFTCDVDSGCVPLTVSFHNISEVYDISDWNFGDGTGFQRISDTITDHTYAHEGNYEVELVVYDKYQYKSDTFTYEIKAYRSVNAIIYNERDKITSFIQEMEVSAEFSENADQFLWHYADTTSTKMIDTIQYHNEGLQQMITLWATNSESGCNDSDTAYVDVSNNFNFKVPNAFVPAKGGPTGGRDFDKGDTHVFYPLIYDRDIDTYLLQIFNRWGQLLFESHQLDIGWDGYYKETLAPQDVYVYKIKVVYNDGSEAVTAGDVTLLR